MTDRAPSLPLVPIAKPLVLATRNAGKLRELRAMFEGAGFALEDLASAGLPDEAPDEDELEAFATFEENARAKARWFAAQLPGRVVVADDSGLAVDALGGAPGVRSKRWSGSGFHGEAQVAANKEKLLAALSGVTARGAGFIAVVVCVDGDREWMARGECRGRILDREEGTGGFGYDPLFWSEDLGASFGVAAQAAKDLMSHRGRSFRALLAEWGADGGPRSVVRTSQNARR